MWVHFVFLKWTIRKFLSVLILIFIGSIYYFHILHNGVWSVLSCILWITNLLLINNQLFPLPLFTIPDARFNLKVFLIPQKLNWKGNGLCSQGYSSPVSWAGHAESVSWRESRQAGLRARHHGIGLRRSSSVLCSSSSRNISSHLKEGRKGEGGKNHNGQKRITKVVSDILLASMLNMCVSLSLVKQKIQNYLHYWRDEMTRLNLCFCSET